MSRLKTFESFVIDQHVCAECGYRGQVEVRQDRQLLYLVKPDSAPDAAPVLFDLWKDSTLTCPGCGTENDVWTGREPLHHVLKNLQAQTLDEPSGARD